MLVAQGASANVHMLCSRSIRKTLLLGLQSVAFTLKSIPHKIPYVTWQGQSKEVTVLTSCSSITLGKCLVIKVHLGEWNLYRISHFDNVLQCGGK